MELVGRASAAMRAVNELFGRYLPRMRRVVRIKVSGSLRTQLDRKTSCRRPTAPLRASCRSSKCAPASIMHWLGEDRRLSDQEQARLPAGRAGHRPRATTETDDVSTDSSISESSSPRGRPHRSSYARTELEELIDAELEQLAASRRSGSDPYCGDDDAWMKRSGEPRAAERRGGPGPLPPRPQTPAREDAPLPALSSARKQVFGSVVGARRVAAALRVFPRNPAGGSGAGT